MKLTFLYRGPLVSCNYACSYCPFAKRHESREEHTYDAECLTRFVTWCSQHPTYELHLLFTPWGEALIHRRYQEALQELSRLPHVKKVAIQTNLSCRLEWLDHADLNTLALWVTYHPSQITEERFLEKCLQLQQKGISFSIGVVGLKEHFPLIERLRRQLPSTSYLWINAYKREKQYYSEADLSFLTQIDPLFPLNNEWHTSFGKDCHTGESVFSVDGAGDLRRCHFVAEKIGNLYQEGIEKQIKKRPCPNSDCHCYIGYIHLKELALERFYGETILERNVQEYSLIQIT